MKHWKEIARENLTAAKMIAAHSWWRSAVSRAYYAAYASVAHELKEKAAFVEGREGPSHDKLPKLIMTYFSNVRMSDRRKIATAARRLYRTRISADYRPSETIEAPEARLAIRDANLIARMLGNAKN